MRHFRHGSPDPYIPESFLSYVSEVGHRPNKRLPTFPRPHSIAGFLRYRQVSDRSRLLSHNMSSRDRSGPSAGLSNVSLCCIRRIQFLSTTKGERYHILGELPSLWLCSVIPVEVSALIIIYFLILTSDFHELTHSL
jgi:hypothetical protein